jgi:hypothetical protein
MNLNEIELWYSVILSKEIERSETLTLVILVNLDHFRHLFIPLYQSVVIRG